MDNRSLVSIPSSECNNFLFTVISEDGNGTQLTVLSALAQANVDPWEEAARLSAMPKTTAAKALVSIFDSTPGRNWSPSEEATIAARLVQLLPKRGDGEKSTMADIAGVSVLPLFWVIWLSFAIAMSILSVPHHQVATTGSSISAPSSIVTTPKSEDADNTLASKDGQSPEKSKTPSQK